MKIALVNSFMQAFMKRGMSFEEQMNEMIAHGAML